MICVPGELVVHARELTIQADYATKIYDGTKLTSDLWIYYNSEDELVEGEILTIVTTGSIINVGTTTNPIESHTIVKANGEDSFNNYDITYDHTGTLEVTPRYFSIKVKDIEREYFGDYLTSNDWEYVEDAFNDNDPHEVVPTETLTLTTIGSVKYVVEGETSQTVDYVF